MREIEFRAKTSSEVNGFNHKKDGIWVYGFYRDKVGLPVISEFDTTVCDYIDYEVDRNTLGQYTGLKDKNGTKIFEGDIIKHFINTSVSSKPLYIYYCINYSEDDRCLRAFKNGLKGYSYELEFARYCIDEKKLEVIGNIYDNPELLEVVAK